MKPICYILASALGVASCSRNIDFDYIDIEPLTVIEANLTPEGIQVALTLTTPMDEPMNRTRLTDATVTLSDLTTGELFTLEPDNENYYINTTPGAIGHKYQLSVIRNGHEYSAETEMYGPTDIIDARLAWISMPYDEVAVLQAQYADGNEPGECYWIKLYRNGDILSWSETDDRVATNGICSYVNMITRKNPDPDDEDALKPGDILTIKICRISRLMHNYLETISNDSNGTKLFSGDRVLGYFLATTPAETSITYNPDEIQHQ